MPIRLATYQSNRCPLIQMLLPIVILSVVQCHYVFGQDTNDDNLGVTVQLPTLGVSIDAQGVLSTRTIVDDDGTLFQARLNAAKRNVPQSLHQANKFRKISLRRLDEALNSRLKNKQRIEGKMRCLAGLTKIEYLFLMPKDNDIVIAGPAEPWMDDLAGRKISVYSRRPVMLLEDFAVALRTFGPAKSVNAWVACSIDPTAKGLEGLKEFQSSLPKQIPDGSEVHLTEAFVERLRNSLGNADVKTYGIHPGTNAANVLIEADYRMKLIAVGLELPPIPMKTFVGCLKGAPKNLQRWWLTPDYQCLRQTPDHLAVQMIGNGVQLDTENILFDQNAKIEKTKLKPSRAARSYASSFTKNFEDIAARRPVFAQLRNVMDCLILAAWNKKNNGFETVNWTPKVLLDESRWSIQNKPTIRHAQCVANAVWRNRVLLMPAGGGVSIKASEALAPSVISTDAGGGLKQASKAINIPANGQWWWD